MPRAPRNTKDIEAVKTQILEAAKVIICKDGFNQLSMRKLAAVLGMTATNIYNYYANKDELYLGVQTAGFAMLLDAFQKAERQSVAPIERLEALVRAYLDFGTNNPDYYEVMLGGNTPKYADYVGTALEKAAFTEKQTALAVVKIASQIVIEITGLPDEQANYRTIQAWTTLHGLVSLHNNRVLQEMGVDMRGTIERICQDLLLPLSPNSKSSASEAQQ